MVCSSSSKMILTTSAARVVLFSVASVCDFVCLFFCLSVYQHDNSRTGRDVITKFSGHHPRVKTKGRPSSKMAIVRCASGEDTSLVFSIID